jgi:lipid A ethanolaminephosphotransferase
MGLKLFRTTGHSKLLDTRAAAAWQSSAFPVAATGRQTLSLVLAITAWVATVCNWPLWQALYRTAATQTPAMPVSFWGHALMLSLGLWAGLFIICAPMAFKRTVRPALTLLLAASALHMHLYLLMGTGMLSAPISLSTVLTLPASWLAWALCMAAILIPLIWLWRQRVLGLRMAQQLGLIVLWLVLAGLLLLAARWMLAARLPQDLQGMPLLAWINPLGWLLK